MIENSAKLSILVSLPMQWRCTALNGVRYRDFFIALMALSASIVRDLRET
ncbi:hypothetical protein [Endozoicomonas numazuensis]|nr:hypothetical protein [Endozoicomonas numazuensis]